jgi:UDP-glucose 4-epimerase
MKTILVTGGIGFIGSHTIVELSQSKSEKYNIIVIDNLSNSSLKNEERIHKLIYPQKFTLIVGDTNNSILLDKVFSQYDIYAVIHFAALKSVSESVSNPLLYYSNNVSSTTVMLQVMEKYGVKRIIFSSSATVYGNQQSPLSEESIVGQNLTNPYGKTKYMIEEILRDLRGWNVIILRYFNPIGAHESGMIGENPNGIPNNLMPYIINVARNHYFAEKNELYETLKIFGNDYKTIDGTGVRDYIHVVDLAQAHVNAVVNLDKDGIHTYNIGTGMGTSVLELVKTFEEVNHIQVPYVYLSRRPGDIDTCYCSTEKAYNELGWHAKKNVIDMCKDAWNFVIQNETANK